MSEQPDPGDGWRWLKLGEVIQSDDEVCGETNGRTVSANCVGDEVFISNAFRRRIDPQPTPQPDLVNAPPHYRQGDIECIDAIRAALTPEEFRGYLKGNVLKYTWREKHKGGGQDLDKAAWYLQKAKEAAE